MRNSSEMRNVFLSCIILILAVASNASRFNDHPAWITAPPAAATVRARDGTDGIVNGPCGVFDRYIQAKRGDTCESIADDNGITMDELLLMNPNIDSACNNLQEGRSYCVGALGSVKHPASILSCTVL